ncbi:Gfo/Idh/MocA family oxidoreductase [Kibdelosporangium philippinense]|uniref:Gfo/Idh/MocA family oxidoreductase n=1 Tax=Kibdelosporangium philippinense TaxID=211113 RepID=A0ABS8ZHL5_9PSEU|nr:Gfo/Idh/MocA family oxidoreductase [Kibdelosporangium philippinense]MCE7007289.1 Gfo/Idh/MocA family oxidoreductase [Kibdelosporangium philippinense]
MSGPAKPLRTIVCGTNFGRLYLDALRALPQFELVGLLSRGSGYSAALADRLGVPSYSRVEDLPAAVDVACVVVPSGVPAGVGTALAVRLLARGVHVLQEHPLHPDELATCLRAASAHGRQYRLNTHYPRLPEVRRFLEAATRLRGKRKLLFADVVTPVHLLQPVVDIIGQALGGLSPCTFGEPVGSGPIRTVDGVIAGVPLSLRVHHQLDPTDHDNHALFWPRITVGSDGGVLTLADVHGPVLWSPRLHSRREDDHRLTLAGGSLELPTTSTLGPVVRHQPTYAEAFRTIWPAAIGAALTDFATAMGETADPLRWGQRDLAVCRRWQQLLDRLGQPDLIRPATPTPLAVSELVRSDEVTS